MSDMPGDDRTDDLEQSAQTPNALPYLEGERRKEQDRRQAGRQGKYDRRRNRCVHCIHFTEEGEGKGQCNFHKITVVAYAFACPFFEPGQGPNKE
jgi:hypothetical protein